MPKMTFMKYAKKVEVGESSPSLLGRPLDRSTILSAELDRCETCRIGMLSRCRYLTLYFGLTLCECFQWAHSECDPLYL